MLISVVIYLALSVLLSLVGATSYTLLCLLNALFVSIPAFFIPSLIFRGRTGVSVFPRPTAAQVGLCILLGVGALFLNLSLSYLNSILLSGFTVNSNAISLEGITVADLPVLFVAIAVIPAISEEFFVRGAVLEGWLHNGGSVWAPLILSSFVFSLLHTAPSNIIVYMGLGMLLGGVYVITRNPWLSAIVHFISNGAAVLLSLLVSVSSDSQSAEAVAQIYSEPNISQVMLFALLAAAIIVPSFIRLNMNALRNDIGRYSPALASDCDTSPRKGYGAPCLICIAILVCINIYSGLIEFGVIGYA